MTSNAFTTTGAVRHPPGVCFPPIVPPGAAGITAEVNVQRSGTLQDVIIGIQCKATNPTRPPGEPLDVFWTLPHLTQTPPASVPNDMSITHAQSPNSVNGFWIGQAVFVWNDGSTITVFFTYSTP